MQLTIEHKELIKVEIDPLDVINKLIQDVVDTDEKLTIKGGNYFHSLWTIKEYLQSKNHEKTT